MGERESLLNMVPGEIYLADLETGQRPVIVVSREELNRGHYVVVVLCTSARFSARSALPNCVPFRASQFGLDKDCVAQCETITFIERSQLKAAHGALGVLDESSLRELIRAIGYVMDADCEPT